MYRLVAAALAAATILTAACSSGSGSASPGTSRGSAVPAAVRAGTHSSGAAPKGCHAEVTPQVCVTVAITGAVSATGTGQTTAPAPPDASPTTTCAQLARWKDTEMDLGGTVSGFAGHTVHWDEDLGDFHGPATYDLTSSDFNVTVDGKGFQAYQDQAASVRVAPDFGVTYTFTGLTGEGGAGGKISGTLQWTCLDPE